MESTYDHNWILSHAVKRPVTHPDNKGWSVCVVEVKPGETAYAPGTTKHLIHGPAFVQYDIHPTGWVGKHLDAAQYKAMQDKIAGW